MIIEKEIAIQIFTPDQIRKHEIDEGIDHTLDVEIALTSDGMFLTKVSRIPDEILPQDTPIVIVDDEEIEIAFFDGTMGIDHNSLFAQVESYILDYLHELISSEYEYYYIGHPNDPNGKWVFYE